MNVLRQELHMYRKSLLTWIISLPALTLLFMLIFPSMAKDMDLFFQIMENWPKEFLQALGVVNITYGGTLGFYSFILTYILLAGSVQAMSLGLSVLSSEIRDKTADFLFAKPVSRQTIIRMKVLAVFLQIAATNLVFVLATWFILTGVNDSIRAGSIDLTMFLLLTGTLALLQIFFACIGLFVSAVISRIRTVLPISMGVVFFFYVLFLLNQTLNNAELAFLSPFSYFELSKVLANKAYEIKFLIAMAVLAVVLVALARRAYLKKDLPSI